MPCLLRFWRSWWSFSKFHIKDRTAQGSYIIDFKKDDINLKSIKYKIESDDEDYLLEESLANFYTKEKEARRRKDISEKEVLWIDVGDNWRIISVDDNILNPETGESWIDLPNSYNLLPMGSI